jgi:NADPH2:quinone reductase
LRALLCREFAPLEALRVENIQDPVPAAGEVLIDIEAASVNYPDALMVQGKYQLRPELPFVPGFECAGTVSAVGADSHELTVGARVFGFADYGCMAERVALPSASVIPIGDTLPFDKAAVLPLTYGTVYHALKDRADLKPGESLLVLGAGGGIGTAAVELGKLMGAQVIAAASTEDKLELARSFGADQTIDYTAPDWREQIKTMTDGKGVDVVCDPVGGPFTETAFRSTGWRGRYLVIGFAAGEIPRLPLNLPLLKGSSIVGVFWGEFRRREPERFRSELEWLAAQAGAGHIDPAITSRYPLADAAQALRDVFERRAKGKVVITR